MNAAAAEPLHHCPIGAASDQRANALRLLSPQRRARQSETGNHQHPASRLGDFAYFHHQAVIDVLNRFPDGSRCADADKSYPAAITLLRLPE